MGDVLGGIIGGTGSLIGGNQAAKQSLTGYNYLTGANGVGGYVNAGSAANNQAASLLGVGGGGGGSYNAFGGGGGGNPGTAAAMGTELQAHHSNLAGAASGAAAGAVAGPWGAAIGGAIGGLASQFSKKNNSPLQDIHQALAAGKPVSDASWAKAGFGPGGSPLGGSAGAPGSANGSPGASGGGSGSAFSNYLNSTGYKFQMQQGQNAISGLAASRGLLGSGAQGKALATFGNNLASTNFNNYLGQLGQVAGRGLLASGQIGQAGTTGGGNAGNAQQSGITNAGGLLGGAASSLYGNFFSGGGGGEIPGSVNVTPSPVGFG